LVALKGESTADDSEYLTVALWGQMMVVKCLVEGWELGLATLMAVHLDALTARSWDNGLVGWSEKTSVVNSENLMDLLTGNSTAELSAFE
jgi:hypothetical protein